MGLCRVGVGINNYFTLFPELAFSLKLPGSGGVSGRVLSSARLFEFQFLSAHVVQWPLGVTSNIILASTWWSCNFWASTCRESVLVVIIPPGGAR